MLRLLVSLILYQSLIAFAAEPVKHTIEVDGHPMALWQKSPSKTRAVVLLLHGRTYSALPDFDLQVAGENLSFMDRLTDLGFTVYALDGRGYGDTPRDSSGWLTPDRAVRDAIAAIEWIKNKESDNIHLYGWSYGSMMAQLVAQRRPKLLASIMLFGYPFDPDRHVKDKNVEYPSDPSRQLNTAEHAASDFIVADTISNKAIQAYVDQALVADPIRVDFKNLHEWAEMDASKVTVPTLLMQAEHDPLAATPLQLNLFTKIPTAKKWWVVLANGDHAALLESSSAEMLRAMNAFMTQIESEPVKPAS
jgi:alpha-beta hydrolase superfamily lysophospholipase